MVNNKRGRPNLLKMNEYYEIYDLYNYGFDLTSIGYFYNVSSRTISRIIQKFNKKGGEKNYS